MVLKFVFVVAIFCHTVRPRRNFEQIREYARVVLHAQKSRKRSGGRHNHMVNHVDLSVFHLVVRTNYARERVYSGNYFSAVVCCKIYYYVSVRHGLLLQNTLLKVGGLIGFYVAVVYYAVKNYDLCQRIADIVNVKAAPVFHGVHKFLNGIVCGNKTSIIAATFKHVVHCGTAPHARTRLFEQNEILAQLRLLLHKVGYTLSRKHIKVRLVNVVGAGTYGNRNYQSHKREQYSRKQFGDKYITIFHGYKVCYFSDSNLRFYKQCTK